MESKFFKEVEFEIPPNPDEQKPKTVVVWDKDKLKAAFKEIEAELEKVKNGSSEYVPRAIDPGRFGFGAQNAMRIFVDDPSDKVFEGIHPICNQDFGAKAGNYFNGLLKEAREEKTNE